jgi:hypothetical protein
MSYQELTANIAALKAQIAQLEGTQLHTFYTAKVAKLETASTKMATQESAMDEEDVIDPYPDFLTFKGAIMPGLIEIIDKYLDGYNGKKISQRGNMSYTEALLSFLGITDITNWKSSFRSNTNIDAYLQTIFTTYQTQLTAMSIGKYTKVVATNVWIDFIVRGDSSAKTTINEGDLGATNPYSYNLVDALNGVPRKYLPRQFRLAVVNYQQNMLTNQPEGFQTFTKEWRDIIKHILSYSDSNAEHEGMSQKQITQNIQNMFSAVNDLIQENKYFTEDDYLQLENITVHENPQNSTPAVAVDKINSQGKNTSNTTAWVFNPEYKKVPPINIPSELDRFNALTLPFVPAPPFPSSMPPDVLDKWLADNKILEGEIPVSSLNTVREELRTIALFLNRNTSQSITITGRSNYGSSDGSNRIALQVGLARANRIKDILVSELGVGASQVRTTSIVGSPIGIIISQP